MASRSRSPPSSSSTSMRRGRTAPPSCRLTLTSELRRGSGPGLPTRRIGPGLSSAMPPSTRSSRRPVRHNARWCTRPSSASRLWRRPWRGRSSLGAIPSATSTSLLGGTRIGANHRGALWRQRRHRRGAASDEGLVRPVPGRRRGQGDPAPKGQDLGAQQGSP